MSNKQILSLLNSDYDKVWFIYTSLTKTVFMVGFCYISGLDIRLFSITKFDS